MRARPLRTVLYVLRRRAAAARGWDAPHALLVLSRLPLVHNGPRWSTSSNRVARATKCLTHPCDLWHHRPSSRRSRSTETQLPRGAMVMSSVDKTRSRRSVGAVRAASCVPYGPKAWGSLPPGPHSSHSARVAASGVPRVPYRAHHTYRGATRPQATRTRTSSPRSTSCHSSKPSSPSARAQPTGELLDRRYRSCERRAGCGDTPSAAPRHSSTAAARRRSTLLLCA